ncbi:hypothetical protein RZS08_00525, partial [Arthrospira platensis SPKY1]|nr:hypothetical protein [Arthrospira platensis SPKY1]
SDFEPTSPVVNSIGANLQSVVPFDIFGAPRPTSPDPGAIEFDPPPGPNPGISAFVQPSGATCGDSTDVEINIINFGLDTVNTMTISWTVNGTPQTPVNWT